MSRHRGRASVEPLQSHGRRRTPFRCVLVTQGPPPQRPTGNALLHRLFGAEVVTVATTDERRAKMHEITEEVNAKGGHAILVPLGSLGYARADLELMAQLDALEDTAASSTTFVSASSCVTLAGLLLLALLERTDVRLIGVSADASAEVLCSTSLMLAGRGSIPTTVRAGPQLGHADHGR
jgi:1-aminocyclopropane-1-carboxylate deaminase/D-cysteine desulfhydrase-like pyridoxal-dependent ACC family enzyme